METNDPTRNWSVGSYILNKFFGAMVQINGIDRCNANRAISDVTQLLGKSWKHSCSWLIRSSALPSSHQAKEEGSSKQPILLVFITGGGGVLFFITI